MIMEDKESTEWWNSLTEKEREYAFCAVVTRMYQSEVKDRGTYRYAIYNVFGFDPSMYIRGMDCGYMDLHNIICDGLEKS